MIDAMPAVPVVTLHGETVSDELHPLVRAWITKLCGVDITDDVVSISYQMQGWPQTSYVTLMVCDRDERGRAFLHTKDDVAMHPLVRRWSGEMPAWFIENATVNQLWKQERPEKLVDTVTCSAMYSLKGWRGFRACMLPADGHKAHRDSQGFGWTTESLIHDRAKRSE